MKIIFTIAPFLFLRELLATSYAARWRRASAGGVLCKPGQYPLPLRDRNFGRFF